MNDEDFRRIEQAKDGDVIVFMGDSSVWTYTSFGASQWKTEDWLVSPEPDCDPPFIVEKPP